MFRKVFNVPKNAAVPKNSTYRSIDIGGRVAFTTITWVKQSRKQN